MKIVAAAGAIGAFAFLLSGPLQHVGALPKTAIGDASKTAIKRVLDLGVEKAYACPGGRGGGFKGNNGFGNGGFDGVPGKSGLSRSPNAGQKRADRVR